LIDLAGIGLIIESLAHELTRTIEHSADIIKKQRVKGLSPEHTQFFNTLKAIIDSIDKRLRIIDPLSVSARQRRRDLDLRRIVHAVVDSHAAQFERHDINVKILPRKVEAVPVFAVEGRIIQIIENLISNSTYWLDVQRQLKENEFREIVIVLNNQTIGFQFSDSGPGVPPERREKIFAPFYSTKSERKRQGLGLYIARECAEFHGGTLYLDESQENSSGNLATFIVEIPDTRKKSRK
jgi:signal transduction histidine kinase